ncbi:hypothetical protein, partial [Methanosarcina mazei]|uniref:hypothetical protein n=1 Tax=Methanosarcina mazei TaxID=2209 RepID=UPI00138E4A1D
RDKQNCRKIELKIIENKIKLKIIENNIGIPHKKYNIQRVIQKTIPEKTISKIGFKIKVL